MRIFTALHVTPYVLDPATIPKGIVREPYWPPRPSAEQWHRQSTTETANMLNTLITLAQAGSLLFVLWGLVLVLGTVFPARSRRNPAPEAKSILFIRASSL
ncbi:MAG TPA: hypothetical protein VGI18_11040 [Burkholderiales bacterium]|jgi:hypothetical protein